MTKKAGQLACLFHAQGIPLHAHGQVISLSRHHIPAKHQFVGATCIGPNVRGCEVTGVSNPKLFVDAALGQQGETAPCTVAQSQSVGVLHRSHQIEVQDGGDARGGTEQN